MTDAQLSAEILSWSRSKGLFAGIALTGATLRPDNDGNQELYGKKLTAKEILMGDLAAPAAAQPTSVMALAVSGMNDVLNSQGYTQAAFWNRIPTAAWGLMMAIAICCNLLFGYSLRSKARAKLLVVLPIVISIAFMLVADIDTPRHGIVRVSPQNLVSLAESLRAQ